MSGYVYDFEVYGGKSKGPPDGVQVPPALEESECHSSLYTYALPRKTLAILR